MELSDLYAEGYKHGYEDATADSQAIKEPEAFIRVWMTPGGGIEAEWKGCERNLTKLAEELGDVEYKILEEFDDE